VLGVEGGTGTEEVGGGPVPFGVVVAGGAGLCLPEHEVHGQQVLQGLLLNLLLGFALLGTVRIEPDVRLGVRLR
jgi:hypothetical protein